MESEVGGRRGTMRTVGTSAGGDSAETGSAWLRSMVAVRMLDHLYPMIARGDRFCTMDKSLEPSARPRLLYCVCSALGAGARVRIRGGHRDVQRARVVPQPFETSRCGSVGELVRLCIHFQRLTRASEYSRWDVIIWSWCLGTIGRFLEQQNEANGVGPISRVDELDAATTHLAYDIPVVLATGFPRMIIEVSRLRKT